MNKRQKMKIICSLIIIILNVFTVYSFGKYVYQVKNIKIKNKIAQPLFIINSDDSLIYNNSINEYIYEFKISNYKNNQLSDVSFKYNIDLNFNKLENIDYEIFKDDEKIIKTYNGCYDFNIYNTKKDIQKFKIKINLKNHEKISDLVDMKIKISAYQIIK